MPPATSETSIREAPASTSIYPFAMALEVAERAHWEQLDKAGEPKIHHALRVGASLLPDLEAAVVGLLHDVLEDSANTITDLMHELPLSEAQVNALALLTRPAGDHSYDAYIRTIATAGTSGAAIARKVKIADLKDNLNPRRQQLAQQRVGLAVMVEKRLAYWQALCILGASPAFLDARP